MYKAYLNMAVHELVKAITPRVVPVSSDDPHVFAFSVEIDLPPGFVKGQYK